MTDFQIGIVVMIIVFIGLQFNRCLKKKRKKDENKFNPDPDDTYHL